MARRPDPEAPSRAVVERFATSKDAHSALGHAEFMRACADPSSWRGKYDLHMAEGEKIAALDYLALKEPVVTGFGGEMVPQGESRLSHPGIVCAVQYPDIISAEASIERFELADEAKCFQAATDAAHGAEARNSLERMLTHQMAACHVAAMKLLGQVHRDLQRIEGHTNLDPHCKLGTQVVQLTNAAARMTAAYQQGMLTLTRTRSGGKQTVTVVHQHVYAPGGQVAMAGAVQTPGG